MPLLYNRIFMNEAEVDGQQVGDEEQPVDYTVEDDNPNASDLPPQDNTNPENVDQNQPQNEPNENEPPVDYTAGVDNNDNSYNGDSSGGNPPPQDQQESEIDDLKAREEELYNELTPEQLDIKHKELKTQFLNMYDMVISIIDRVGDINVAEENIGTVEYVSNTLANLKDMLSDYVNDIYRTKSYIENSINYNRFLAVLNGINKILEEMNSKNDEK